MSIPGGRSHDQNGADEFEGELALTGGDDRLPWLESDDELDQPVVDTGRIAAFALLGLLAVVLVSGSVWFFVLRDDTGQSLVADGSLIEAPAEPYRTRPEDPGGQQVAGTGNASFQVAEGRQIDGRIADMPAPPPPKHRRQQKASQRLHPRRRQFRTAPLGCRSALMPAARQLRPGGSRYPAGWRRFRAGRTGSWKAWQTVAASSACRRWRAA